MTLHSRLPRCLPLLALLLAVAVGSTAEPARAQLGAHRWELSLGLGTASLEGDDSLDLEFRRDLRIGYSLNEHFELELGLMRADAVTDRRLTAATANLLYNFRPRTRFVPYVLVGAGHSELETSSHAGESRTDSSDGALYQAGVGARYFLDASRRFALRGELSSLWQTAGVLGTDRTTSATAGISWTFGRR